MDSHYCIAAECDVNRFFVVLLASIMFNIYFIIQGCHRLPPFSICYAPGQTRVGELNVLPSHETSTANSDYTAMIALGYGIPGSNARALPCSVGPNQRPSRHTKEERVITLVAGFVVIPLGCRKTNKECITLIGRPL